LPYNKGKIELWFSWLSNDTGDRRQSPRAIQEQKCRIQVMNGGQKNIYPTHFITTSQYRISVLFKYILQNKKGIENMR
jgi:hypothetical protein